jgi:hypothetical protein
MSPLLSSRKQTYHNLRQSPCAPVELRETPFALRSSGGPPSVARRAGQAKGGGAGGIRTLDRALQPYNGLANRRLQPLGHSSVKADMPDTGVSRKRQIRGCRIRQPFNGSGIADWDSRSDSQMKLHAPNSVRDDSRNEFSLADARMSAVALPKMKIAF